MSGVNKAIIIGNLGSDPEVRVTGSNSAVANFRVATNEVWTDRDGQRQERTEWHRVVVFGRLAELARDYLKKGRQVYIEGKIQTREWTDKDNNRRYTTEIVGQQMTFLGGGEGGGRGRFDEPPPPSGPEDYGMPSRGGGGGRSSYPSDEEMAAPAPAPNADPGVVDDDDIPF